MMKMKRIHYVMALSSLFLLSSCQSKQPTQAVMGEKIDSVAVDSLDTMYNSVDSKKTLYAEKGRIVYLAIESDMVSCYTQKGNSQAQKMVFGHEYGNEGFPIMYSYKYENNIFLVGDFVPNSNGWTVRFPIYRINVESLEMSYIGDGAAVHFDKNGFKVAQCRLTNPDADCTANEIWVMHDSFYDINGKKIKEDKFEYDFEAMEKEYGDSLVNAPKMSI